MPTLFNESGTRATRGLEFFTSVAGDVSSSNDLGDQTLKVDSTAGNVPAYARWDGITAASGRVNFWVYLVTLPATDTHVLLTRDASASAFDVGITAATKKLTITSGTSVKGTGSTVLETARWYHCTLAYTITSTSVNAAKLFVNGVEEVSVTNQTISTASPTHVRFGFITGRLPGASRVFHYRGIHIDDDSSLTSPGMIEVVAKLPAALNTNNFDTTIGSGTNRWDYVDERPLSESNGLQHAGATDVQENFGLQAAAAGDVDLTGATIIARTAWAWAKRGALTPCTHRASAAGGGTNPSTTDTITIGSGTATGDALYVLVTSRDHTSGDAYPTVTDDDSGGNTWTRISENPDASRKATLWWKRATSGTASKTITVAGCIGSMTCGLSVFQNAATSVDPHTDLSVEDNASANETHATITATNWGSSYVFAVSNYNNDNAVTSVSGATVGSYGASGRWEKQSTAGTDCAATMWSIDGADSAPVATGAVTWSQTNGVTTSFSFAVRPEGGVGSPDIMDNGSETAITLTATSALFTKITDSASYPSNAAGIGLRSTGTALDTFLYECGTIIAYIPAVAATVAPWTSAIGHGEVHGGGGFLNSGLHPISEGICL